MMKTVAIHNTAWNIAHLRSLQSAHSEMQQQWQAHRLQALSVQGFPGRRDERWKYTDITPLLQQTFALGDFQSHTPVGDALKDVHTFVFINGYFKPKLSQLTELASQASWHTLAQCISIDSTILEQLSILPEYQTAFSTLNDALFSEGLVLDIPKNTQVLKPIHVIHTMEDQTNPTTAHLRKLIRVGENAEVTIFEEYDGQDGYSYFNNVVTQIEVARGGRLQFYQLQRESREAFHVANTIIQQERDSDVRVVQMAIGARLGREDLYISLAGTGAICQVLGLAHLEGRQHLDFHSRVDHRVPMGESEQNYRSMVAGHACAVFNEKVIVHPQAKKSKALQSSKNLLLSEQAAVNTQPELEIYNDDVQCAHGATVGQLDERLLTYLRSRSLDRPTAQQLLIRAFVDELLTELPASPITDRMRNCLYSRLAPKADSPKADGG